MKTVFIQKHTLIHTYTVSEQMIGQYKKKWLSLMSLIIFVEYDMKVREKQHISRSWDQHCRKITTYGFSYTVKQRPFIVAEKRSMKHQLTVVLILQSANTHCWTCCNTTVLLFYAQVRLTKQNGKVHKGILFLSDSFSGIAAPACFMSTLMSS